MSKVPDIFSFEDGRLPEEKLQAYLDGKLTVQEQHEVERWLSEQGMESDAVEGLKDLNHEAIKTSVNKLNYELRRQLAAKKRRHKNLHGTNQWSLLAIFIILLLCALAYIVIQLMKR